MNIENALSLARTAAAEADRLMMKYYKEDYQVYTKPGERSRAAAVLTEPDLICDEYLRSFLSDHFPDCGLVTEESVDDLDPGWYDNEHIWYVDPIDGSRSYMDGTDSFGVSLALCRRGVPILGIITNPAEGWTAWAAEGKGAYFNNKEIRFNDPLVATPPLPVLSIGQNKSPSYRLALAHLQPDDLLLASSVVTKSLLVLHHRADYYFSLPWDVFKGGAPNVWDLAGAAAIVREAGGLATDCYGRELIFDTLEYRWLTGHIFAHPAAADSILSPLQATIQERKEMVL